MADEKLKPEVKANTTHADLIQNSNLPTCKDGDYLMATLDENGKEKADGYFCVNERTYNRSFTDTKKFVVKKKPNNKK